MTQEQFIAIFCDVFEHSEWVAQKAWDRHPFNSVDELHAIMVEIVANSDIKAQLKLLQSHPELAGKAAKQGELTLASHNEQAGANLDCLSSNEMKTINRFNQEYSSKFDFSFIIAVRHYNKNRIFLEFERRLNNEIEIERNEALKQVGFIAQFRLEDIFKQKL